MTDSGIKLSIITAGGQQMFEGDTDNIERICRELPENPVIVEIGSWTGHSAVILAHYAKEKKGKLFCVDSFDGAGSVLTETAEKYNIMEFLEQNLEKAGVRDYVTIVQGKSDDMFDTFPYDGIDLLFIDGDHRYSQVCRDIDNWLPRVRGVICGHDYDIDSYNLIFPEDQGEIRYEHLEEDCVLYPYGEKKVAVHYGVLKAVRERFPKHGHFGRIWFQDVSVK
jgi:hypothetical protein